MSHASLQEVFRSYKSDREIFHDMMPLRTREILLVASVYDAFTLEEDGLLSEILFGDYYQLNLTNPPRVTNVSSVQDALEMLETRHFDLVIVMSRLAQAAHHELSRQLRAARPHLPIYLLLNDNVELGVMDLRGREFLSCYDHIFVWNGNSEVFLAMIKFMEDRNNVANDTAMGLVRVILLVEDSVRYYSRYLPILYGEILKQTRRLAEEHELDGTTRTLRMRARPKVLLATSFEEAMAWVERYQPYLLCVISDRKFPMGGVLDGEAGVKLIRAVKEKSPDLATLLQSSDPDKGLLARELGSRFINKNSPFLGAELSSFLYEHLGFGDFIFRGGMGQEIARAANLAELLDCLRRVPITCVLYHASHNHFSAWLMARGEVQISRLVLKIKASDFEDPESLRENLIHMGDYLQSMKTWGKVMPFVKASDYDACDVLRLGEGSVGGKSRGVSFVHSLLAKLELDRKFPYIDFKIPKSLLIGTVEFTAFIERNELKNLFKEVGGQELIKKKFLSGELSEELKSKLFILLDRMKCPLAVRSSSLLEDSLSHPFSGLYDTFFLSNNHPDLETRVEQVLTAIKLVYASVYSRETQAYFQAISYEIEEEKMGVLIQEMAGRSFGARFYPHISGVAQSFNYYPFAYLQPEEGVAMLGFGLGKYVVEGGRSFRFCPSYPQMDMQKPLEQLQNTQDHFYALDMSRDHVDLVNGEDATLLHLPVSAGEADGSLTHCASTWDADDERIRDGLGQGARILNFRNVVKYDQFPLAPVLQHTLALMRDAMETPVEIEFAVNLDRDPDSGKPTFYLLQIKHQQVEGSDVHLDMAKLQKEALFLFSDKCVGNGVVEDLQDIVWVDPLGFDLFGTVELAMEVERMNQLFRSVNGRYLLIGPGRWGSSDRHLGIPITWPMISCARAIVEYSTTELCADASLGSHFFHNVTSLNIGYFTIPYPMGANHLDWEWLRSLEVVERRGCLVHSRCFEPLHVVMDGRRSVSAVFKRKED